MRLEVDLSIFDRQAHTPSLTAVQRALDDPEAAKQLRDFCVPVNSYFPPEDLFDRLRAELKHVLKYYPSSSSNIAQALSGLIGIDSKYLVLGNGSTELISWIDRLFVKDSILVSIPTFGRWTDQPRETGKTVHTYLRVAENGFRLDEEMLIRQVRESGTRALAISNPNNPTGALLSREAVLRIARALSHLDVLVVDESFIDFSEEEIPSVADVAPEFSNVIVLKSLGKNFGLHGIRFGYAVTNAKLAAELGRALPPWNMNALAELVIRELPLYLDQYEASRRRVIDDRVYLESELRENLGPLGVIAYPSQACFVYAKLPPRISGIELRDRLLTEHGILIRECGPKIGSDSQHLRIVAKPREDTDLLIGAMKKILAPGS